MEEKDNQFIDPILFKAASTGNFEPFSRTKTELSVIITPDKNTILHIHLGSQNQSSTSFIEQVLDICPSLLWEENVIGDTPLHVAAKYGHHPAVECLINYAKNEEQRGAGDVKWMLRKTNDAGNTGLHEAVRHEYQSVVRILVKADPNFSYSTNKLGETPIFIAVEKNDENGAQLVEELLTNCRKLDYRGPHGRTALHAAAKNGSRDFAEKILEKEKRLAFEVDDYGWTPLHYAAYYNNLPVVKLLLKYNESAAYLGDRERKMTPLHLAAGKRYTSIMREIVSTCPTCFELVDIKGRNVLHFFILSCTLEDARFTSNYLPVKKLILEKDEDGNTPLHLFASFHGALLGNILGSYKLKYSTNSFGSNKQGIRLKDIVRKGYSQLQHEILELSKVVDEPYREGVLSLSSREDLHIIDQEKERRSELEEDLKQQLIDYQNARESHLVVAALIATVSFTAIFTLPGGFIQSGSDQGTAVMKTNSAFQAFVITDAVAVILSVSAVFIHFLTSLAAFRQFIFMFRFAFWFTIFAMVAMVLAFVAAAYAMLSPSWVAVLTAVIGSLFCFAVILIFAFLMIVTRIMAAVANFFVRVYSRDFSSPFRARLWF